MKRAFFCSIVLALPLMGMWAYGQSLKSEMPPGITLAILDTSTGLTVNGGGTLMDNAGTQFPSSVSLEGTTGSLGKIRASDDHQSVQAHFVIKNGTRSNHVDVPLSVWKEKPATDFWLMVDNRYRAVAYQSDMTIAL